MEMFGQQRPFYKKKKFIIPLSVIGFLILLRIILPPIILTVTNDYLEDDFSPSLKAHIDDLDLSLVWGTYKVEGISARIKDSDKTFLEVGSVQASVEWRNLIKGKLVADVVVDKADFTFSRDLLPAVKKHLEYMKEKGPTKKSPLRIARLDFKDSVIRTGEFPTLTREEGVIMSAIRGRIANVTPSKALPMSPFNLEGTVLGSGLMKATGVAKLEGKPLEWSIDSEMKHFELPSLDRFLKKKVPLTFTRGTLDLYAEAKSENNVIKGYIKPFIKNLDVIKTNENFKNTKQWFYEIVTALGNVVLESDKVSATRIPFTYDGEFKVDTGETISKAVQNGFQQELNRGIENSISL